MSLQAVISQLLQPAVTPSTYVIVAPPGSGKTTHLAELLSQPTYAAHYPRVLWAVLQTGAQHREDASPPLAAETAALLRSQPHAPTVTTLYGRTHFSVPKDYHRQFTWTKGQQHVALISHAHLPWLFQPGDHTSRPHAFARAATLLVIDEDPTGSLLRSSTDRSLCRPIRFKAWLELLTEVGAIDGTANPVLNLLKAADTFEGLDGVRRFGRPQQPQSEGLTGAPFWSRLTPLLSTDPAWHGPLEQKLAQYLARERTPAAATQAAQLSTLFMQAFLADVDAARGPASQAQYSTRIGAHRLPSRPAYLRFNLRQPLQLHVPTIILDGYAHPAQYSALLPERPPIFHTVLPSHPRKLEIELAPEFQVHRLDLMKKAARAHRGSPIRLPERYALIAQELQHIRQQQRRRWQQKVNRHPSTEPAPAPGLLLLSSKDFQSDATWHALLQAAFGEEEAGFAQEGEHLYWYVGRGKNIWSGNDVVALNIPKLPATYAWYEMSALYPYDRAQREALTSHVEQSELLQMLHRGRQVRHARSKPRVILAAAPLDVAWLLGAPHVEIRPYKSHQHIQPHAKQALTHARLVGVVEELYALHGLVPAAALVALGLIEGIRAVQSQEATASLRHNLSAFANAPKRRPHLHACYHGSPVTPLKAVNPARLDRLLDEPLQRLGLVPSDFEGNRIYRPPEMTVITVQVKWKELTRPTR